MIAVIPFANPLVVRLPADPESMRSGSCGLPPQRSSSRSPIADGGVTRSGVNRGRGVQPTEVLTGSAEVDRQVHGIAVMLGRRLGMAA